MNNIEAIANSDTTVKTQVENTLQEHVLQGSRFDF